MNRIGFWIAPASTGGVVLAVYGPFGFGRDFGLFTISLFFVLPALVLLVLAFGLWSLLERRPRRRSLPRSLLIAALAPAVLIPTLWCFGEPIRDPWRYAVWSTFHPRELEIARRRDGIFKHWDSWGGAGEANDSYLASDPADSLSRPGAAARWTKDHRLGCDLVGVRRMARGVYLLTTSNCAISGSFL